MARSKITVDANKLKQAVQSAEADGPLTTMTILHDRVATEYNKLNPPKNITASVVGLRLKEFKIEVQTKPGKRGRRSGQSQGPVNENIEPNNILCPLSDWFEVEVTKGPSSGQKTEKRWILAGYKWGWLWGLQSKGSASIGNEKSTCDMTCLLQSIDDNNRIYSYGLDWKDCAESIVLALAEATNMPVIDIDVTKTTKEMGAIIDRTYKVSHHQHDNVCSRIFKNETE